LTSGLDGEELLAAVRRRNENLPCWVLVIDNADNLGLFGDGQAVGGMSSTSSSLYKVVPRGSGGTVLWTSRDERIGGSLAGPRCAILVGRMTMDEAEQLLERASKRDADGSEADVVALCDELERLPLAISQAASRLENGRSCGEEKRRRRSC